MAFAVSLASFSFGTSFGAGYACTKGSCSIVKCLFGAIKGRFAFALDCPKQPRIPTDWGRKFKRVKALKRSVP